MKLNNKGFAITSVLYGLLILFVVMTSSYLTVLSAKKNRLDNITKEIEDSYDFNTCYFLDDTSQNCKDGSEDFTAKYTSGKFTPLYTGKYIFLGNNSVKCYIYVYKDKEAFFNNLICDSTDTNFTSLILKQIYYHKENNNE